MTQQKQVRTRNNHVPSETVNVNRIITAQQYGYDANDKYWKMKDEFRGKQ